MEPDGGSAGAAIEDVSNGTGGGVGGGVGFGVGDEKHGRAGFAVVGFESDRAGGGFVVDGFAGDSDLVVGGDGGGVGLGGRCAGGVSGLCAGAREEYAKSQRRKEDKEKSILILSLRSLYLWFFAMDWIGHVEFFLRVAKMTGYG